MTTPVCTSGANVATRTFPYPSYPSYPSFASYMKARQPVLLRTARSLTPNPSDAEDLLQTALTKTYVAWERIEDHRALDGYVRRALLNTRTSQWRKRKVDEFVCAELPEPEGVPAGDPAEQQALRDAMWRAIMKLAGAAAGHGRPAVLRGPERGTDGGGARRLHRDGEVGRVAGAGQAA